MFRIFVKCYFARVENNEKKRSLHLFVAPVPSEMFVKTSWNGLKNLILQYLLAVFQLQKYLNCVLLEVLVKNERKDMERAFLIISEAVISVEMNFYFSYF